MPDEGWPARTWADRRSDAWYRLVYWWACLRHPWRRWGPRCAATGPWRLPDCGTCILARGHERWARVGTDSADWHADGTGYTWNDTLGRWQWMGPVVDLADEYDGAWQDPPSGAYAVVFTEAPPA